MKLLIIVVLMFLMTFQMVIAQHNKNDDGILAGEGLMGRYYQGYGVDSTGMISFGGLTEAFSRIDSTLNFWNGSQFYRWEPVAGWGNNYSVGWDGFIFIEQAGQYGFGTMSDDGSQIFIDDVMIVNNGESQWYDWEDNVGEGDTSGTPYQPLILDSGFHQISVRFFEKAVYDGLQLWWLKPGSDSSDIPYYGTNFHGIPPTYNPNTNWEIIPKSVLFPAIPVDIKERNGTVPAALKLYQNYPNPFNGETLIRFSLIFAGPVRLEIFDNTGRLVNILLNKTLKSGDHQVKWRGADQSGNKVTSGIYYYRISSDRTQLIRKLLYIK